MTGDLIAAWLAVVIAPFAVGFAIGPPRREQ